MSESLMPQIFLGGMAVSRLALGGAGWSLADEPDVAGAVRTIHAAIDHGVTLIDTARAYTTLDHPSHNEWLISRALRTHPAGHTMLVATKGGHYRSGPVSFPVDGSPAALRRDCEQSLHMLRRDTLDLFQLHRADDTSIPIEDSVAELAALRTEGKIRCVGLCNVTVGQLVRARAITTIDTVQNRYSPMERDDEVLGYCVRGGLPFLAYSPLGGRAGARKLADVPAFRAVAAALGCTVQQIAVAWLMSVSSNLIPIVGTGRPEHVVQAATAAVLSLTSEHRQMLGAGVQ
jgi:aryl-alcohol dehydrogenase-like predicted oxidoreductase